MPAVMVESEAAVAVNRRRRPWAPKSMLVLIAAVGLVWGVWTWWEARRSRMALEDVKKEVQDHRYGAAVRQLAALLDRRPNWDEAAYFLGVCEQARGRIDAALAALERIRPDSAFIADAIQRRAALLIMHGRQIEAEQLIQQALRDPRIDGSNLRGFLVPYYWQGGRLEEAERLLEANWEHLDRSSEEFLDQSMVLLRAYIQLRQLSRAEATVRSVLDQTSRLAPDDDRIWLAKANLAIRQGAFDEASRWLEPCLRRRPEDVPIWNAYLQWALATNRVAEAQEALRHIPAEASTPAMVQRLAAWLAVRRGDIASERRALERLVVDAPADGAARDRLAELAILAGQPAQAAALRGQKSAIARALERYHRLVQRNQPMRDAAELARLAEQVGRWFEARVFLTIAALVEPQRGDLDGELSRLNRRAVVSAPPGRTLAEVLALELGAGAGTS